MKNAPGAVVAVITLLVFSMLELAGCSGLLTGTYAVVARRKGADWYVGCLNAVEPRILKVPLDFLPEGQAFEASVYFHDPSVNTRTKVGISRRAVDSKAVLDVSMSKQGGMAVRIYPVEKKS